MARTSDFLKGIGLEDLSELFDEEDINMEELVKMGQEDLKSIGVKKFGQRQRIINAVESHLKALKDASAYGHLDYSQQVKSQLDINRSKQDDKEANGTDSVDNDSFKSASDYEEINTQSLKRSSDFRSAQSPVLRLSENTMYQTMRKTGSATVHVLDPVANLIRKITTFRKNAKERLNRSYTDIKHLLERDILSEAIQKEIAGEFGDIENLISERIPDLDDESCPIVITGETSAGKSSFVNLLLGVDLMPQSSLSCTSTICRIHNSSDKSVTLVQNNKVQETLTLEPNISCKAMKDLLKKYVSVKGKVELEETNPYAQIDDYAFIDISWPMTCLDENILIVDTPGVSPDDPELTARLFQYLPKALAFIYVLNTPNAGGVQSDRILQIQSELEKHSNQENVQHFDAKRAIFICNKWDQIHEDPEDVFKAVEQTLKGSWHGFESDRLFRLSTREEMKKVSEGKTVSEDFEKILYAMEETLPLTIKEKYLRHIRYQEKLIKKILQNLSARIRSTQRTKEENEERSEAVKKRIQSVQENLPVLRHIINIFIKLIKYIDITRII